MLSKGDLKLLAQLRAKGGRFKNFTAKQFIQFGTNLERLFFNKVAPEESEVLPDDITPEFDEYVDPEQTDFDIKGLVDKYEKAGRPGEKTKQLFLDKKQTSRLSRKGQRLFNRLLRPSTFRRRLIQVAVRDGFDTLFND